MRLFFALPVPGEAKEALRGPLETAKTASADGVGFTRVEQLHFTLAFLGEQPDADKALAAGETIRKSSRFEVALSGVGAFPNTARPRVLWLGVSAGASELMSMAERLRAELRSRGFAIEERMFRPHLTLGRVRPRGERGAKRALAALPPAEFARWTAHEACLMQSMLGRGGATHTVLRSFPLHAN
jgi:2'-5' RNA ligase